MIHPFKDNQPKIHDSALTIESAHVIGDVVIGAESSIRFNAVVRGDVQSIRTWLRSYIQDG